MILPLSYVTAGAYRHLIKPLLFRTNPDIVHQRILRLGRTTQRLVVTSKAIRMAWAHKDTAALGQTIHNVYFPNPVGLAAGFDKNAELVPTIKAVGFGYMTGGSVTLHTCTGNPHPWFQRLPKQKSLVVNVGLANEGVQNVLQRIQSYTSNLFQHFPLVMSVAKTNNPENCDDDEAIADYIGSLQQLKDEPSVSVLEINISCPNAYGGEPFTTAERLHTLLSAVDSLDISKPIWVKMPINLPWHDFEKLLSIIAQHNVQGLTIGNLNKDRSAISSDEFPEGMKGSLSGLPTQALSDELIGRTYATYADRFTIIGVGGIFNAEDAYRKICLGASLVGLVTGVIYEGPQLIGQLNRELCLLLKKDGLMNVSEAVGSRQLTSDTK